MSNERTIPASGNSDLVTYTIKVDGKQIKDTYDLASIVVNKEVNRIPFAKVTFYDGDVAEEDFELSGSKDFVPGNEIEILAGYHTKEKSIFKGIIIKHGIKVRYNRPSVLIVECKDEAVKMTVGRKNAYYYKQKDSDIIGKLIGNAGVKKKVVATKIKHEELIQYYATDWDFMLSRAEVNGMVAVVSDGEVNVKKPNASQGPVITLTYGSTILEFEGEIDARFQFSASKASAWDAKTQKIIESKGTKSTNNLGNLSSSKLADVLGLDSYDLQHAGQITKEELKDWADSQLLRSSLAKVCGRVRSFGTEKILPGTVVELAGLGDRFNGKAYVSGVRHEISEGNWTTDTQIGLPMEWFSHREEVMDRPASGLLPGVFGLQIGVVKKIADDPDKEHRIQVNSPIIDAKEKGVWARIATLDAGKERGTFFMPEVGDEVVLGFLNDDPRDPIILGMLHSSKNAPPWKIDKKNPEKGFLSREKLTLLFNDKDKFIEISTPAGNKITLSDKDKGIVITDENKNIIELSKDGILIDSAKDLTLKAKGNVSIEGTKIESKAKADYSAQGANVKLKAQAQFKAEGAAGAELSTSAIAVLKGSLVQIN